MRIMSLQTTEDEAVAVNVDHVSLLMDVRGFTRLWFTNGRTVDIATPIVELARAFAEMKGPSGGASND